MSVSLGGIEQILPAGIGPAHHDLNSGAGLQNILATAIYRA